MKYLADILFGLGLLSALGFFIVAVILESRSFDENVVIGMYSMAGICVALTLGLFGFYAIKYRPRD